MSQPLFKKATREKVWLKLAVTGPSGSGKTYSALRLARGLVGPSGRIAVLDTENNSASLYADRFEFDTMEIPPPFESEKFVEGINAAVQAGYGCIIIDSASHLWEGILEYKNSLDARGGNSYTNWKPAGDKYEAFKKSGLQSKAHIIICMRSKTEYSQEKDERGRTVVRKIGLAPIMRDGMEYEVTTSFDVALDHKASVSKDRSGLFVDKIFQITEETGAQLEAWRLSGSESLLTTQLTAAIGAHEPKANAFLVTLGWLKDGQTFRDLSVTNAEKVLANSVAFLAKVNA
jgi:GTPase SAR1 family protein